MRRINTIERPFCVLPDARRAQEVLASKLSATRLAAGFGRRIVIRDVDLAIEPGCLTVLLGPNGSGKSTLLSTLARLLPPRQGSVLLDGADISRRPTLEVARKLGLLPQQPPVPEGLTVAELVGRGRFPHQGFLRHWSRRDEAAVDEAMALTGISHLATTDVEALSGGQRQRVWISMVLAQKTPLLLLDEPTTFLDIANQVAILTLLRRLVRHHGRTIVCVLHDLNMALQYADRFVFVKDGVIKHTVADPKQCTGAIIEEVFDTSAIMVPHPQTGLPVFLPRYPDAQGAPA
ncbi:ABC transporter ATP-binding protein [Jiella sp. MQZ9-1]|uniref:ABC transporter ATP-binding protein n=1 Tax=Jiella flava TaxID=2816857 RepID=A0A939FYJ6_9HYPH|nr:ABC transporter ATP-binding protein [Jiella flava]MBO0661892.1 ABC transporter ATP-binding protein [Jiella flava]MCD2470780.1 ABC transporter ATP-binding protein [Jiella flava]